MEEQTKDANINVIQSVWRRVKKGHIKVRDLQPEKDVKGGGGVAGRSPVRQVCVGERTEPKAENRLDTRKVIFTLASNPTSQVVRR
jgi:hypothetical protein